MGTPDEALTVANLDVPAIAQPTIIKHDGRPTHVVLAWQDWRRIADLLDDLRAAESAEKALAAWRARGAPSFDLDTALADAGLRREDLLE